jgi:hypothetical protein
MMSRRAFGEHGRALAGADELHLGAILYGHFGDRYGRKNVLISSVLLMGAATVPQCKSARLERRPTAT